MVTTSMIETSLSVLRVPASVLDRRPPGELPAPVPGVFRAVLAPHAGPATLVVDLPARDHGPFDLVIVEFASETSSFTRAWMRQYEVDGAWHYAFLAEHPVSFPARGFAPEAFAPGAFTRAAART